MIAKVVAAAEGASTLPRFGTNRPSLALRVSVALQRIGLWPIVVCVLALLCTVISALLLPRIALEEQQISSSLAEVQSQRTRTARAAKIVPALPDQTTRNRLASLDSILLEPTDLTETWQKIYGLAARHSIKVNQADFKHDERHALSPHASQMQLPIKGRYVDIRAFCEAVLRTLPYVSLDELSFKRDSIASDTLEVRLRFSVWQSRRVEDTAGGSVKP